HSLPLSLYCYAALPELPPFPTRRSSDLKPDRREQQHRAERQAVPGILHHRPHRQIALDRGHRARRRLGDRRRLIAKPGEQRQRRSESTRLNSSHVKISYAVFCLKKKTTQ